MSTQTSNPTVITIRRPCCASVRECSVRALYIIGIKNLANPKILRTIEAVRCYRVGEKYARVTLTNDILIVYYYISNRGNEYITIYKPKQVDAEIAILTTLTTLGYQEPERYAEDEKLHIEVLDFEKLIQQPQ
jgi:hypothetical protein